MIWCNYFELRFESTNDTVRIIIDPFTGGVRKGADSYFPPEDRVRLVRLVSHGELPGEKSGEVTTEISQNNL